MEFEDNQELKIYNSKKENYMRNIHELQYIFEITKCCGYGEWVSVFKDCTLINLYENIKKQFYLINCNYTLYVINNITQEKLLIPLENILIKDYINNNNNYFKPLYPIPSNIIYKIWLDDGHCHNDHHYDENVKNTLCVLHI